MPTHVERYTVARFNINGYFAAVLVDDQLLRLPSEADKLLRHLEFHFKVPVILIDRNGNRRGINRNLVNNFNVHPSQISGWEEITLTIRS